MIAFLLCLKQESRITPYKTQVKYNTLTISDKYLDTLQNFANQWCKNHIFTPLIMTILMKGLTIFRRTTKSEGLIKLRF